MSGTGEDFTPRQDSPAPSPEAPVTVNTNPDVSASAEAAQDLIAASTPSRPKLIDKNGGIYTEGGQAEGKPYKLYSAVDNDLIRGKSVGKDVDVDAAGVVTYGQFGHGQVTDFRSVEKPNPEAS